MFDICLPICLSINPSIHPSLHPSVCLSQGWKKSFLELKLSDVFIFRHKNKQSKKVKFLLFQVFMGFFTNHIFHPWSGCSAEDQICLGMNSQLRVQAGLQRNRDCAMCISGIHRTSAVSSKSYINRTFAFLFLSDSLPSQPFSQSSCI